MVGRCVHGATRSTMPDEHAAPAGVTIRGITEQMEDGASLEVAAALSGVSVETIEDWIGCAEHDACVALATGIAKASAQAEMSAIERVREGDKGWQGAAHWLAMAYPERWAKESKPLREALNRRAAAVTTEDAAKEAPPEDAPQPARLWTPKIVGADE